MLFFQWLECVLSAILGTVFDIKVSGKTKLIMRRLCRVRVFNVWIVLWDTSYHLWYNLESYPCTMDHSILVTRILYLPDTIPCFTPWNKTQFKDTFSLAIPHFSLFFFIPRQSFYHCSIFTYLADQFLQWFLDRYFLMSIWASVRFFDHAPVPFSSHLLLLWLSCFYR